MKRLLLLLSLALVLLGAGLKLTPSVAQVTGCGTSTYGSLSLITKAFAQVITGPCSTGVSIQLSNTTIIAGSADSTVLGTASAPGTTGTATWSLTDGTGTFQINSSTGVVTVLSNTDLTAGNTIPIIISVTGLTPAPSAGHFTINVISNQNALVLFIP